MSELPSEVIDIPESFDDGFAAGLDGDASDENKKEDPYYVTGYKFGKEERLKSSAASGPHTHIDFEQGFLDGLADVRAKKPNKIDVRADSEQYKSGYNFGYDSNILSMATLGEATRRATRTSSRLASRKGGSKTKRRMRKRSKKSRRRKQKK